MSGLFGCIQYKSSSLLEPSIYCGNTFYYDHIKKQEKYYFSLILKENNRQPRIHCEDPYIIALFGEIYNGSELMLDLGTLYHNTPIELIIIELFKRNHTESFKLLKGSFSLVLYDQFHNKIYLLRDKIGTKPLYFYSDKNSFIFGTSLKDFNNCSFFKKNIDHNALALYFQFSYIPHPYTIFENTHKVISGSYVCYELDTKVHKQHPYWSIENIYRDKDYDISEKEIIKQAHSYLEKAIDVRATNHSNFGSFLSGGYDSTLIAAMLQKQSYHKIKTFTIGFYDSHINEASDAKKIAAYLDTEHIESYCDQETALNVLQEVPSIYDEPLADHAVIPTIIVAKLAEQANVSLLFGGDGGDEIFTTQRDISFYHKILSIPKPLRKNFCSLLKCLPINSIPVINKFRNFPIQYYKFFSFLESENFSQILKTADYMFIPSETKRLLNKEHHSLNTPFDTALFDHNDDIINVQQGMEIITEMVHSEIVKSYTALNSKNLDFATPFLDDDLIHFMGSMPTSITNKNS